MIENDFKSSVTETFVTFTFATFRNSAFAWVTKSSVFTWGCCTACWAGWVVSVAAGFSATFSSLSLQAVNAIEPAMILAKRKDLLNFIVNSFIIFC